MKRLSSVPKGVPEFCGILQRLYWFRSCLPTSQRHSCSRSVGRGWLQGSVGLYNGFIAKV